MKLFLFLVQCIAPLFLILAQKEPYKLSICTFLPKTRYRLTEWLEYHKNLGVEHFFLYYSPASYLPKNDLAKYTDSGEVELFPWPEIPQKLSSLCVSKMSAYENACNYAAKEKTKWLIFMEPHEFLVPDCNSLLSILETHKNRPALVLSSCYYANISQNAVEMIQSKRLFSPDITEQRQVEKTIFQPKLIATSSLSPYKYAFRTEIKPKQIAKSALRVQSYLPSKRNKSPERWFLCDPGEVSTKEIKQAADMGYGYIDCTYVIDEHMANALE